jgi:hypothetical protein
LATKPNVANNTNTRIFLFTVISFGTLAMDAEERPR